MSAVRFPPLTEVKCSDIKVGTVIWGWMMQGRDPHWRIFEKGHDIKIVDQPIPSQPDYYQFVTQESEVLDFEQDTARLLVEFDS